MIWQEMLPVVSLLGPLIGKNYSSPEIFKSQALSFDYQAA